MKDREIIETLNDMKGVFGERGHSQYSLVAIDRAIDAIEKQIPKKVGEVLGDYTNSYYCDRCGVNLRYEHQKYCDDCGGKQSW